MGDIAPELLRLITVDNPLVIDQPCGGSAYGWGWLGAGQPISHAIVERWELNHCLKSYVDAAGKEYADVKILTEFGERCRDGKVKTSELVGCFEAHRVAASPINTDVAVEDGRALFTQAGTCRLCTAKMDIYGQISHAKSHINKGHDVVIEERGRKKFAMLKEGVGVLPEPIAKPTPGVLEPGEVEGRQLFSSTGICRLCSQRVNVFGWNSHAKSHIRKGDPVEILLVNKKHVPMVKEGIVLATEQLSESVSDGDTSEGRSDDLELGVIQSDLRSEPHLNFLEEEFIKRVGDSEGVKALMYLQKTAGQTPDKAEAARIWATMDEIAKRGTIEGYWLLEKGAQ